MRYYATLGPMFNEINDLSNAINLGLDGIRINLSHGPLIDKIEWIQNIKACEEILNKKVEIILDIEGTDFRINTSKNFKVTNGELISIYALSNYEKELDENCFFLDEMFINSTKAGDILSLDDGLMKLEVINHEKDLIIARCLEPGSIINKKGISNLSRVIETKEYSKTDLNSISLAKELGLKSFMLPFVRTAKYVSDFRDICRDLGHDHVKVYSKIEDSIGIKNLDKVCQVSDVIVIARGDLGSNLGLLKLPKAQKEISKICTENNRSFMVVTQLLDSMIVNQTPTRAEVNDIYNCILDGAGALMLTSETASGKNPLKAINFLVSTRQWSKDDV